MTQSDCWINATGSLPLGGFDLRPPGLGGSRNLGFRGRTHGSFAGTGHALAFGRHSLAVAISPGGLFEAQQSAL